MTSPQSPEVLTERFAKLEGELSTREGREYTRNAPAYEGDAEALWNYLQAALNVADRFAVSLAAMQETNEKYALRILNHEEQAEESQRDLAAANERIVETERALWRIVKEAHEAESDTDQAAFLEMLAAAEDVLGLAYDDWQVRLAKARAALADASTDAPKETTDAT